MLFWIIALVLASLIAATVLLPLWRGHAGGIASEEAGQAAESDDVAVYRDQLAEVERDLARGVLDPADAERTRTEIARRLLAADRAGPVPRREAPRAADAIAAVVVAAVLVGGGLALYRQLGAPGYPDLPLQARLDESERLRTDRPSQAEAEAAVAAAQAPAADLPASGPATDPAYRDMVAQLRELVPSRPDDLQGWLLLSRHEAALGNYAAAARAQERVIALRGTEATPGDYVALVDRMVAAADGIVTPEAEAILQRVTAEAPDNAGARYYLGLLYAQSDRPDLAFRLWRDVVATGDANTSVHVRLARLQIEEAAFRAGVEYTLPPPGGSGPSAADIAAAQNMAPEDRDAMIRGMVSSLSDRLATQGGPVEDWARLITAYGVLGERETAAEILAEARDVFGTSPAALEQLEAAARGVGLAAREDAPDTPVVRAPAAEGPAPEDAAAEAAPAGTAPAEEGSDDGLQGPEDPATDDR